ncbi:uncharacterized conserved protein [Lichtheimia corymbifera JMRC:FSU:9682]|uniref:Pre-rRNA-processing protein n=1 Tax=Lichtheimia corymbifera JMRC:FSU:9682 TaxID=1263082 RepID=A0A068S0J0_9FUNG|nr:uncharacterized conserved protein [Lichtheimia corymbifera JMRC:FSU:9682]
MPNAKKKRQAKNEDFKKKKLKVGKKKALPDNYTDTTFRSKSIALPNQSITEDKSRFATTSRNLTLNDVLSQLKHYNAGVRKDAISGLEELYRSHPTLITASLGQVVNGILKLLIDDDRDVRKALLGFLQETFPSIKKADIQPFLPLLIIYTCSAMSHIFEDIRNDAVKLMDLWVSLAPEVVVSRFWNRVVGIYMSLLSVSSTNDHAGSSIAGGSKITNAESAKAAAAKSHLHLHKSKLGPVESLSRFLQAGLAQRDQDKLWFLDAFFDHVQAKEGFRRKMEQFKSCSTQNIVRWDTKKTTMCQITHPKVVPYAPYLSNSALPTLNLFESAGPKNTNNKETDDVLGMDSNEDGKMRVKLLIETFQPVLLSTWLDAAPTVFATSSTITLTPALQLLSAVLHLTLVLWRALVSSDELHSVDDAWIEKHCHHLLKHFVVYFPYGADVLGDGGPKANALLRQMNIETCELTSLYMLAKLARGGKESLDHLEWVDKVVDHVLGLLGYEDERTSSNFKEDDLSALLPAVWGFLNGLDRKNQYTMFKTFMDYYQHCHAHSGLKRTALEFLIGTYLQVQSSPSYNGRFVLDDRYRALMNNWVSGLPKTLWQLKTSHPETSAVIVNFLCEAAKRSDQDIFEKKSLEATELALVPFFYVNIASKGELFGPFIDLPKETQQRALEFVYYVDSGSTKVANAIEACKKRQG